jgi:mRNA interferase MazF
MKPGDIVLIRFPEADLTIGKLRPALVVAVAPGRHADLLLTLISSRTHQTIAGFDEIIDPADSDYKSTGLKARSVVRIARLVSVEPSAITARLGTISSKRLRAIRSRLVDWLQK